MHFIIFLIKKKRETYYDVSPGLNRDCRAQLQIVLERIHPLQFEFLWGKFSSHVIVVLNVRWDEHGDWSSSHKHFDIVTLCGKVTSERSS